MYKKRRLVEIKLSSAIASRDYHCEGYGNPGNEGTSYVLTMLAAATKVAKELCHEGSKMLDQTLAFDCAEVSEASIGQINMINVSSFCGPDGYIWGIDLAKTNEELLFKVENLPVYSAEPLFTATRSLFGTIENPVFPILPGSHVPCACQKTFRDNETDQPLHLYATIGLGIAEDRNIHACLLMEDTGFYNSQVITKDQLIENVAKSIIRIGSIQKLKYTKAYVGLRTVEVNKGEMGCALVAAPYIALARKAIPKGGFEMLHKITIKEWDNLVL